MTLQLEDAVVNALTLTRALAELNPADREALLLVAAQGLTYKEAAEIRSLLESARLGRRNRVRRSRSEGRKFGVRPPDRGSPQTAAA